MCGIAGILSGKQHTTSLAYLRKMTGAIAHRGPDGEAHWANGNGNVLLGHRRLAIIDTSAAGAQPMHYLQRYTIVHNGEIYNYTELKQVLQQKGYVFQSRSDTEVILAAYDCWKEKCVQQFDGMFAFAIWDEREETLFAARDRFGEKPFYYYDDGEHFIFASEMKALWAVGVEKEIDQKMLLNYITLGQVQNPTDTEQTFFQSIYSLPAAHYLQFTPSDFRTRYQRYWRLNKEAKIDISADDAINRFQQLFTESVKRRLRSDVPVGGSISGGLDSSSIMAAINSIGGNSKKQVAGFSAVFPGFEKDESAYIDMICQQFNIRSHRVEPTAEGLVQDFERLCYHQEEPFQSSSVYAQFKVFELAGTQGIKVLLDGQGADELLAGYPRYIHWYLQEVLSRHKLGATQKEKRALQKNGQPFRWGIKNHLAAFLPSHAAMQLERNDYERTISHPDISPEFQHLVKGHEWEGIHKPIVTKLNDILHFNITELGLEELLRFADRNSMAHGREVRLPFLGHELAEFIFSLPSSLKIHEGFTKWLLRKAMDKQLPDAITWRTDKVGYEPPQKKWMENPLLADYVHEARKKLVNAHILKPTVLHKGIQSSPAHAADNYDWRYMCAAQIIG